MEKNIGEALPGETGRHGDENAVKPGGPVEMKNVYAQIHVYHEGEKSQKSKDVQSIHHFIRLERAGCKKISAILMIYHYTCYVNKFGINFIDILRSYSIYLETLSVISSEIKYFFRGVRREGPL
jgi:hypothetical protein